MTDVNDEMLKKSTKYLENPKKFLHDLVHVSKYDTCHATVGYDASECGKDCKKLETSTFAKECRDNKGLFKCCIRYVEFD